MNTDTMEETVVLELSRYDQEMFIYVLTYGWTLDDQQVRDWIKGKLVQIDPMMADVVYGSSYART